MTMTEETPTYDKYLRNTHDENAPILEWDEFYYNVFRWNQGQHIGVIGPTEQGKTTLAIAILDLRKYVVALGTKPKDPVLDELSERGDFKKLKKWEKLSPTLYPKRLLWPDATSLYSAKHQRQELQKAFSKIYVEGGWCIYADELWYLSHHLKMDFEIRTFLLQARSNNISLLVTTQRPSRVPLEVFDQSTHLFFFKDNDERNLKNISGIGWLNAGIIKGLVARLEMHQFLYINTRTGLMYRSSVPKDWSP